MRLKLPHQFGSWVFFIGEENEADSNLIRIPNEGHFKTRTALVRAVMAMFETLAKQGKPEFLKVAQEEAVMMKVSYEKYVSMAVEHQICVRSGGMRSGICYPSGLGDKLHSFAEAIDNKFAKAPRLLKKVYEKIVPAVLSVINKEKKPEVVRFSGCGSCGGRKSFSNKGKNMGRAGRMQKKS